VASSSDFGVRMREHLAGLERHNAAALDAVAEALHRTLERDGLVYTAGSGHSLALVLETFYRAGGLACVYPLYHPGLLPLAGGQASTLVERAEGLAELLLEAAAPGGDGLAFVFSNSGVNPFPVELAKGLRRRGTPVVAVSSVPHMQRATARAGVKLSELADHLLDTRVPYGDAAYPAGSSATGSLSSLASVYLWNLLLTRLADRSAESGVDLPLWTSANVEGGEQRNAELFARYRPRVPML
jgi:uncharacterized phosphosugar-binding protein